MPSLRRALRHVLFAAPIVVAAPLTAAAHGDDAPKVVTSIKPIHGITSAIMKDIGEPVLLIDGASSPHTYSLRPSEARALNDADLVIYVSHALEGFLEKPLESLSGHSHQLELVSLSQLSLRNMREGGTWEGHMHAHEGDAHDDHEEHDDHTDHAHDDDHDHDHEAEHDQAAHDDHDHDHVAEHEKHDDDDHHDVTEHHEHDGIDTHIWMDPANGATIAIAIADELAEIDPEHADDYRANLQTLLASLTNLGNDLRAKVAPVQDKPYVVFHDAYQYLEAGLGLNAVGSITVSPDQKPGAKRLHEIEDKIHDTGAVCIFAEPQFRPAIVQAVVSDTGIRTGTLDPLGFDIAAGPTAYQEILAQNVDALVDCLGDAS
ncbi:MULTISPECIES: zinc ABC transporter substrate-binding protein [Thalassospira]|uniref:High-affinity zinc uptake system protein ZnuA n=2 Tax=Thalassospira tepidiphila TaxID=393657 RepID=A0A853KV38_9PROT|nr:MULTISPECIES: zinc ABC transporter substrate-binding protein [Thalassospira]MBO6579772.1 zinc ABC transporter substrate-binding protein [Thalassospira sp.]MBO6803353.1 zinc ABC transporter substrate-binding protein [Thalassospira sp.]MBO6819905.1 zinc ABC transporter substrate-binding protein [Thalassospira sp.]MBO6889372.1 zinc ABC transporter substrate-binding protein [Thalassospira sp.]NJB74555.1 zinc transport system substrate-binding protein [Thalassospira tepidiphila]